MLEPAIEPRLVEKRDQLRSRTALTAGTGGALERSGSLLIDFFTDHAGALANSRRLGLPLVLVMDTFEELLIAYAGQLEPLLKWLQFVQGNDGFHDIRLILSGRAVETLKQGENPRPGSWPRSI
ncbi:hypothetical protein AJ88_15575 [Mesorhizobium amorphae CCBAU 01583]|nr:hypothetical protein AJ88_15575 [Mesorhizobium amorphae CCBAU 01583]